MKDNDTALGSRELVYVGERSTGLHDQAKPIEHSVHAALTFQSCKISGGAMDYI